MDNSILDTIKKLLGIAPEYDVFDLDIITHINSVFMILNQIGVKPEKNFHITGRDEVWSDFLDEDDDFNGVQTYVYLRVSLLFDPPNSGVLHEAKERQIEEYEWRLYFQAESKKPCPAKVDFEDSKYRRIREEGFTCADPDS